MTDLKEGFRRIEIAWFAGGFLLTVAVSYFAYADVAFGSWGWSQALHYFLYPDWLLPLALVGLPDNWGAAAPAVAGVWRRRSRSFEPPLLLRLPPEVSVGLRVDLQRRGKPAHNRRQGPAQGAIGGIGQIASVLLGVSEFAPGGRIDVGPATSRK